MKYIIKNSDIMLNGKIIPEGSEVELSEEQTKGIESFLQPCHSEHSEESDSKSHPEPVKGSKTKIKTKGNKK